MTGAVIALTLVVACVGGTTLKTAQDESAVDASSTAVPAPTTTQTDPPLEIAAPTGPTAAQSPLRGGPIRLVPPGSALAQMARIRGIMWPLVPNTGDTRVYPAERGLASFYHEHQKLATGGTFNPNGLSAAHRTLPFGTLVRVTRLDTGAAVVVVINDRGPFVDGRIIDLSLGAARVLKMVNDGVVRCRLDVLAYPLIETMGPNGSG